MAKSVRAGGGSTPALAALARAGSEYELRAYDHYPSQADYGREAAAKLDVDDARVFKTLLAEVDGVLTVGIVPVAGKLDLKALAAARGGKRGQMADPALAEKKTGYVVGGISPIGQKSQLPTVIDTSAQQFDTVLVSGGRRGLDIEISPENLLRATRGQWSDIAKT